MKKILLTFLLAVSFLIFGMRQSQAVNPQWCASPTEVNCNNGDAGKTGCMQLTQQCIVRSSCCAVPQGALRCQYTLYWCTGGGSGGSSCETYICGAGTCTAGCI